MAIGFATTVRVAINLAAEVCPFSMARLNLGGPSVVALDSQPLEP